MIVLRLVRVPSPKPLRIAALLFKIHCWQACASYHSLRVRQALAGLRDARLKQHSDYFEEIQQDAEEWILFAHTNMAIARSELQTM